jgi:predicted PurR-regulated permease PerM
LLQDYAPQFQEFLRQASQVLQSVGVSQEKLEGLANELSPSRLVELAAGVIGGIAGVLSDIFFLIVLLFFTVADAGDFASKLTHIQYAASVLRMHFSNSLMALANILQWRLSSA